MFGQHRERGFDHFSDEVSKRAGRSGFENTCHDLMRLFRSGKGTSRYALRSKFRPFIV